MQQQNTQDINLLKDKILELVKTKGPVLPVEISQETNIDLIFSGAILSEFVSRKLIFISNAKIGGSPIYYTKEQNPKLPDRLYNHLRSREKEAYDLLNKDKVLKDTKLEPAHRVAIRSLKDFAIPLNVTQNENTELFWKYFLVNEEEAKNIIEELLKKPEVLKHLPEKEIIKEKITLEKRPEVQEKQKAAEKLLKKPIKEKPKQKDCFYEIIKEFLSKNKIKILEEIVIRKQKDFEFIVKLPSSVGHLEYYIKARSKKTINDTDLSLAYSESQQKKLPCLFITSGKLTKKAEALAKKLSGQLTLKQI